MGSVTWKVPLVETGEGFPAGAPHDEAAPSLDVVCTLYPDAGAGHESRMFPPDFTMDRLGCGAGNVFGPAA